MSIFAIAPPNQAQLAHWSFTRGI